MILLISTKFTNKINEKNVINKFRKGEISISEAFEYLTNNSNYKLEKEISNTVIKKTSREDLQNINKQEKLNNLLRELDKLVGLEKIKEIIKEYLAFVKVQKLREQYNLKTEQVVMHMIFKGNPGTGKTTVARIIGKIFKEIGFLLNGDLIEAERSDLVGEYIGHTAQKTKKVIDNALGGVLFIDEAYALARGGEKDFGKEAIDTMVKAMEDYKDKIIIILAGYRNEMNSFLECNPGLRSRFAIQLDFPDYSIEQLVKIAEIMYQEREYVLDSESKHYIYRVITKKRNKEGLNNGNARMIRNLVERSIRHQAKRLINNGKINRDNLLYIKKADLPGEEVFYE